MVAPKVEVWLLAGIAFGVVSAFWSPPALAGTFDLDKEEDSCLQKAQSFAVFGECIKKASLKKSKRSKPRDEQKDFFAMIDGLSAQTTRGEVDIQTAMNTYVSARADLAAKEKERRAASSEAVSDFFGSLGFGGSDKPAFDLEADENICIQTAPSFSAFGACVKTASLRLNERTKPRNEQKDFFVFIDQLSAETDAGTTDMQAALNRYVQARLTFQQTEARRLADEEYRRQQAAARARAQAMEDEYDNTDAPAITPPASPVIPATGSYMMLNAGPGRTTIQQPGRAPVTVQRYGNSAIVQQPGQPNTTIRQNANGAVITTPGQMPSTVLSTGPNSATINTPGQAPTTVNKLGNTTTFTQNGKRTTCTKAGTLVTCN